MMTALRSWLISVVVTAFLLSVTERIVPKGTLRKITSITGGMILILALLRPLTEWRGDRFAWNYEEYRVKIEQEQADLQQANHDALSAAVAEKTEAYITRRAADVGIPCRVSVDTQLREDGIPIPWSVTLDCAPSAELEALLEQELNIPIERQVYDGAS